MSITSITLIDHATGQHHTYPVTWRTHKRRQTWAIWGHDNAPGWTDDYTAELADGATDETTGCGTTGRDTTGADAAEDAVA